MPWVASSLALKAMVLLPTSSRACILVQHDFLIGQRLGGGDADEQGGIGDVLATD